MLLHPKFKVCNSYKNLENAGEMLSPFHWQGKYCVLHVGFLHRFCIWVAKTVLYFAGNSILHTAADSVTSAVQKASQALNERGERLGRAEEKTEDMKNSAQQFAETAHKVRQ